MIIPQIEELVGLCAAHGICHAIISPGSRSAAISIALEHHPDIEVKVVADERSAAFIAIGMAQKSQKTVVLVCTSGTASLNYAPAIAEAFYQEIPLLVITADRPPEWVDQYDGQTINQDGIYGEHVKASFSLPVEIEHSDAQWSANRQINQALIKCLEQPLGPVHINVPIREPFYPEEGELYNFDRIRKITSRPTQRALNEEHWKELIKIWNGTKKRMLVLGQHLKSKELSQAIHKLSDKCNIIVLNEITGNQHALDMSIQKQDLFLSHEPQLEAPELLITLGNSLISKNLKIYLRNHRPKHQWHLREGQRMNDSLQSLTQMLDLKPAKFIQELAFRIEKDHSDQLESWREIEQKTDVKSAEFLKSTSFGELFAISESLKVIPPNTNLHLANSMAIRYANFIGIQDGSIEVFSNRGTSGIDGSNATAVGCALTTDQPVTLITGDMAFLYDRNAFWHEYKLKNLRIIVMNNSGGGIFGMIPGPKREASFQKLFQTHQPLSAKLSAQEYGFEYFEARNSLELNDALNHFYEPSENAKVLEVFSNPRVNEKVLKEYKSYCLGS